MEQIIIDLVMRGGPGAILVLVVFSFTYPKISSIEKSIQEQRELEKKENEDRKDEVKRINDDLKEKACYADIKKHDETIERIFDQLNKKEDKTDCTEWRKNTWSSLDEIKIMMHRMDDKIDRYMANGNGRKVA